MGNLVGLVMVESGGPGKWDEVLCRRNEDKAIGYFIHET